MNSDQVVWRHVAWRGVAWLGLVVARGAVVSRWLTRGSAQVTVTVEKEERDQSKPKWEGVKKVLHERTRTRPHS